jgi:hypothetical protein
MRTLLTPASILSAKDPICTYKTVLWIRIVFNADPDVNADSDPEI